MHCVTNYEDFTMYTIKALYLRDGKEKAKEYLHQQLTEHPNSQILHYMKDNWKSFTNDSLNNIIGVR